MFEDWKSIPPKAFEIHCWLSVNAPQLDRRDGNVQLVQFQPDDVDEEAWETTLMPEDCQGPTHVVYHKDRIEVLRYWFDGSCPQTVAVFAWDNPRLLENVLIAATKDMAADWGLLE